MNMQGAVILGQQALSTPAHNASALAEQAKVLQEQHAAIQAQLAQLQAQAQQKLAQAQQEAAALGIGRTATNGTNGKRTRTGVNKQYARLNGSIPVTKFVQALAARTDWHGKARVADAQKVLALFGWEGVSASSVQTALYDGSHAMTNKGTPNAQHKPAQLTAELLEQLDNAVLFVTTGQQPAEHFDANC